MMRRLDNFRERRVNTRGLPLRHSAMICMENKITPAVVMSLVQSAKMNGHDPWQYLRDVLARLPTHLNSRIEELLPHPWQPSAS